MKRLLPFITFACLTGFTATSGLPIIAGGCNSYINKKAQINCAEDDNKCKAEKAEKFELNKTIRS